MDPAELDDVHRRVEPGAKHKVGLQAYDVWVKALEGGTYVPFGLRYDTVLYADTRKHAARYLERLAADGVAGLGEAVTAAKECAAVYDRMLEVLGMEGSSGSAHLGQPVTETQANGLVPLVREARGVEARQVELVKRVLGG